MPVSRLRAGAKPKTAPKTRARVKARASTFVRSTGMKSKPATDGFGGSATRRFDLRSVLESAARVRRGSGPEGTEPVVTQAELARVTKVFSAVSPERSQALQKLVLCVPEGPARALMLKAIGARASRLATDVRPLKVLERFAAVIAPLAPEELLENATVLDLDSRVSTSNSDPMRMWSKQGTVRAAWSEGSRTNNDGLIQRFTATCGPTVIQMMRAQTDPVLAFAINAEGRASDATHGATARFQRALIEEYGGIAIGRRESYVMARLNNAFARLGLPNRELSDANIEAVRDKYGGFPGDSDVQRVRATEIRSRDIGIGTDDFREMLDRFVGSVTGAKYAQTDPPEGFGRGQAVRFLDDVERSLRKGFDVAFGVCQPDHWMMMSHVRGKAPTREFLVTDPDGGRTAWVTQKQLVDGSFADIHFHLPKRDERPYIDSFFMASSFVKPAAE